jgi:hypothetical protein
MVFQRFSSELNTSYPKSYYCLFKSFDILYTIFFVDEIILIILIC